MTGARKNVSKLLDFIKSVSESDSALYDKTKQHLIEIAQACNEIECAVSEILKTAKPRGFDPNVESENTSEVAELRERVDNIEKRMSTIDFTNSDTNYSNDISTDSHSENTSETIYEITPETASETAIVNTEKDESKQKISKSKPQKLPNLPPEHAKEIKYRFAVTLQNAADTHSDITEVNQCCDLLWRWYDKRFLHKYPKFNQLKYDTRKLKRYIYSIVTCFGYHLEHNTLPSFLSKFDSWIDSIGVSEKVTSSFCVPYEANLIFQYHTGINKSEENYEKVKKFANHTAIVLWDQLWEHGYSRLGKIDSVPNAQLKKNGVFNLVLDIDVDAIDRYDAYMDSIRNLEGAQ